MAKLPPNVAVRVHNVHKDFHLPHHNENSIKRRVINAFQRKDKSVDTLHALRGLTFDINSGDFFGVLGRNGSGKSTLLKIIAEIYQPTNGYTQHRGKLVSFIELGVGFNPELTGRENIYLNGAMLGFSRQEISVMYDEIVGFAELEEFMEQKLKNYSSGMKVRLAFSVAIRAEADILVLDEVLAVGDAAFQRKCYDYFKSLKEAHKTVILVTHSMGAVKEYCNKAVLIEDGKIAFEGEADEAADEYLRLFNKPEYEKRKKKAETEEEKEAARRRWGSREVEFSSIDCEVNSQTITINCHVKNGSKPLKELLIGLDIHKAEDQKLVGGVDDTVKLANQFELAANETRTISYSFDNIFGGGSYNITLSLRSRGGHYIYDFWRQATSFTNVNKADSYFPVILPVKVSAQTDKSQ